MDSFPEFQTLRNTIITAGELAQNTRKDGLSIKVKGRQDFVTQADVAVENFLRQEIQKHYPDDAFLGEESGLTKIDSSTKQQGIWVIDPIDGTTNYSQNMDYWCISIAYVVNNVIKLGFIYAPDKNEFFFAKKGAGAYLNNQKLAIHDPETGKAIIGLGRSNRIPLQSYIKTLTTLDENDVEYRRFGAGALMLAHVAANQVNGYFEAHLNSWDALAGLLLIEEAGGRHNPFLVNDGLVSGNPTWAASPKLWAELEQDLLN